MGGGSIDRDINPCDGSDVLAELNAVFNDPNSARYKFAQRNNSFGAIRNVPGNYRALIEAYETAGVEDIRGWAAYLRRLGTGPSGPQKIYRIAQVRHKALSQGVATLTTIHAHGVKRRYAERTAIDLFAFASHHDRGKGGGETSL